MPDETNVEGENQNQESFEDRISRQFQELQETVSKTASSAAPVVNTEEKVKVENEQRLAEAAKTVGLTPEALKLVGQIAVESAASANLPSAEANGKQVAKETLGEFASDELTKAVEEKMKMYPANIRSNAEAWKSAAFMVLGENYRKINTGGNGAPQRTITSSTPIGNGTGAPSVNNPPPHQNYSPDQLRDRQTMAKIYFGGDERKMDEYRASKQSKINQIKAEGNINAADREYLRLTQGVNV